MKTLKNLKNGNFVRVSDVEAEARIKAKSEWAYAPKSEWKKRNSSSDETVEATTETPKKDKKKN